MRAAKRSKCQDGKKVQESLESDSAEIDLEKENDCGTTELNASRRRKSPHLYTVEDDVDILFAVQEVKPFGKNSTEKAWMEVHDQVSHIKSDWKSKKNRFLNEIKWFTSHENKSKRGSGVVETYNLKDKLLTEIVPLMKEAEVDKSLSTIDRNKRAKEKAAGEEIRMAAMSSMGKIKPVDGENLPDVEPEVLADSGTPTTPRLKRRKDDIIELIRLKEISGQKAREEEISIKREKLEILKSEKASEMEERNRKLALEERRLALEEKKLEFEMQKYLDNKANCFTHVG